MELTKKDKILISFIVCLLFIHVVCGVIDLISTNIYRHGLTSVFKGDGFGGAFILFVFSWIIMVLFPVKLVLGHTFHWPTLYIICGILAWFSLFALIRYTRGMKLAPRIVYLYLIPALIMSLGYLYHLPLH